MTDTRTTQSQFQLDGRLLTAAEVLLGAGAVLWVAGLAIGGAALRRAAQEWLRQLEQPPSAIVKGRWQQAATAATAGVNAWKRTPPTST